MSGEPAAIIIANDGGKITQTNYWQTSAARRGLYYVSINAGTVRLLMPPSQEANLTEIKGGKQIVLTRGLYDGVEAVEIMFDDRSNEPFALWLDLRQFDRLWPVTDDGKKLSFNVYTQRGRVWSWDCYLRRVATLPCLQAWGK